MEDMEMMTNEANGDFVGETRKSGLKTAAKVGLVALIGFGIYKLGKKAVAKYKASKDAKLANDDAENIEADSVDAD